MILSSEGDVTADYVVRAVEKLDCEVVRINTEDLLSNWRVAWTPEHAVLTSSLRAVDEAKVRSVYFRRAYPPAPQHGTSKAAWQFVARESRIMLLGVYAHLDCPWISHFTAVSAAENKPRQLRLALSLGFSVPETLVTNDAAVAETFVNSNRHVVLKALSYGELGGGAVLHTTLLSRWHADFAADIALCPVLLQEYVEKSADWRVTVVDDEVFACRIESQTNRAYSVDMRRGLADLAMAHTLARLPGNIEALCTKLVKSLGLRFGAIDLAEDRAGALWFLEVNPNGQWAWIEDRTGAPISNALARGLVYGRE